MPSPPIEGSQNLSNQEPPSCSGNETTTQLNPKECTLGSQSRPRDLLRLPKRYGVVLTTSSQQGCERGLIHIPSWFQDHNHTQTNIPPNLQQKVVDVVRRNLAAMEESEFAVKRYTQSGTTFYPDVSHSLSKAGMDCLSTYIARSSESQNSLEDGLSQVQDTQGWELPTSIKNVVWTLRTGPHHFNDVCGTNASPEAQQHASTSLSTNHDCAVNTTKLDLQVNRNKMTGKVEMSCSPKVKVCGKEGVQRALTGYDLASYQATVQKILSEQAQTVLDHIQQWAELPSNLEQVVTKEVQTRAQYPQCDSLWDSPHDGPRVSLHIPYLDDTSASPEIQPFAPINDPDLDETKRSYINDFRDTLSTKGTILRERCPDGVNMWNWTKIVGQAMHRVDFWAQSELSMADGYPRVSASDLIIPLDMDLPRLVDCSRLGSLVNLSRPGTMGDGWGVDLPEVEPAEATHLYAPHIWPNGGGNKFWRQGDESSDFIKIPKDDQA